METVQADKIKVLALYKRADKKGKNNLISIFGKDFFIEKKKEQKEGELNTLEDCCRKLGINPKASVPFPKAVTGFQKCVNLYWRTPYENLVIIVAAHNDGWEPNWEDKDEYKYLPYFTYSGSAFSYGDFAYVCATTGVASRLCFKDSTLAESVAKKFIKEYNDYFKG